MQLQQLKLMVNYVQCKLNETKGSGNLGGILLTAMLLLALFSLNSNFTTFITGLFTTVSTFFTSLFTDAFKRT